MLFLNPLWHELLLMLLFFPLIFEIGSYRLPSHKRGTHRKFFQDPFLFLDRNFGQTELIRSLGS